MRGAGRNRTDEWRFCSSTRPFVELCVCSEAPTRAPVSSGRHHHTFAAFCVFSDRTFPGPSHGGLPAPSVGNGPTADSDGEVREGVRRSSRCSLRVNAHPYPRRASRSSRQFDGRKIQRWMKANGWEVNPTARGRPRGNTPGAMSCGAENPRHCGSRRKFLRGTRRSLCCTTWTASR